jgi:hypothetical protein
MVQPRQSIYYAVGEKENKQDRILSGDTGGKSK